MHVPVLDLVRLFELVVDLVEGVYLIELAGESVWNFAAVNATPPAATPVVFSNTLSPSDLSPPLWVPVDPAAVCAGVPDPVDRLVPRVDQVDILILASIAQRKRVGLFYLF